MQHRPGSVGGLRASPATTPGRRRPRAPADSSSGREQLEAWLANTLDAPIIPQSPSTPTHLHQRTTSSVWNGIVGATTARTPRPHTRSGASPTRTPHPTTAHRPATTTWVPRPVSRASPRRPQWRGGGGVLAGPGSAGHVRSSPSTARRRNNPRVPARSSPSTARRPRTSSVRVGGSPAAGSTAWLRRRRPHSLHAHSRHGPSLSQRIRTAMDSLSADTLPAHFLNSLGRSRPLTARMQPQASSPASRVPAYALRRPRTQAASQPRRRVPAGPTAAPRTPTTSAGHPHVSSRTLARVFRPTQASLSGWTRSELIRCAHHGMTRQLLRLFDHDELVWSRLRRNVMLRLAWTWGRGSQPDQRPLPGTRHPPIPQRNHTLRACIPYLLNKREQRRFQTQRSLLASPRSRRRKQKQSKRKKRRKQQPRDIGMAAGHDSLFFVDMLQSAVNIFYARGASHTAVSVADPPVAPGTPPSASLADSPEQRPPVIAGASGTAKEDDEGAQGERYLVKVGETTLPFVWSEQPTQSGPWSHHSQGSQTHPHTETEQESTPVMRRDLFLALERSLTAGTGLGSSSGLHNLQDQHMLYGSVAQQWENPALTRTSLPSSSDLLATRTAQDALFHALQYLAAVHPILVGMYGSSMVDHQAYGAEWELLFAAERGGDRSASQAPSTGRLLAGRYHSDVTRRVHEFYGPLASADTFLVPYFCRGDPVAVMDKQRVEFERKQRLASLAQSGGTDWQSTVNDVHSYVRNWRALDARGYWRDRRTDLFLRNQGEVDNSLQLRSLKEFVAAAQEVKGVEKDLRDTRHDHGEQELEEEWKRTVDSDSDAAASLTLESGSDSDTDKDFSDAEMEGYVQQIMLRKQRAREKRQRRNALMRRMQALELLQKQRGLLMFGAGVFGRMQVPTSGMQGMAGAVLDTDLSDECQHESMLADHRLTGTGKVNGYLQHLMYMTHSFSAFSWYCRHFWADLARTPLAKPSPTHTPSEKHAVTGGRAGHQPPLRIGSLNSGLSSFQTLFSQCIQASARPRTNFRASDKLNVRDRNGWTALMHAVACGKFTAARALLSKGADVTCRGLRDETALDLGLEKGHVRLVKLLLRHGAISPFVRYLAPVRKDGGGGARSRKKGPDGTPANPSGTAQGARQRAFRLFVAHLRAQYGRDSWYWYLYRRDPNTRQVRHLQLTQNKAYVEGPGRAIFRTRRGARRRRTESKVFSQSMSSAEAKQASQRGSSAGGREGTEASDDRQPPPSRHRDTDSLGGVGEEQTASDEEDDESSVLDELDLAAPLDHMGYTRTIGRPKLGQTGPSGVQDVTVANLGTSLIERLAMSLVGGRGEEDIVQRDAALVSDSVVMTPAVATQEVKVGPEHAASGGLQYLFDPQVRRNLLRWAGDHADMPLRKRIGLYARRGLLVLYRLLLDDVVNNGMFVQLSCAVRQSDLKQVLRLLKSPVARLCINHRSYGSTVLFHACYHGYTHIALALLLAGADPHIACVDELAYHAERDSGFVPRDPLVPSQDDDGGDDSSLDDHSASDDAIIDQRRRGFAFFRRAGDRASQDGKSGQPDLPERPNAPSPARTKGKGGDTAHTTTCTPLKIAFLRRHFDTALLIFDFLSKDAPDGLLGVTVSNVLVTRQMLVDLCLLQEHRRVLGLSLTDGVWGQASRMLTRMKTKDRWNHVRRVRVVVKDLVMLSVLVEDVNAKMVGWSAQRKPLVNPADTQPDGTTGGLWFSPRSNFGKSKTALRNGAVHDVAVVSMQELVRRGFLDYPSNAGSYYPTVYFDSQSMHDAQVMCQSILVALNLQYGVVRDIWQRYRHQVQQGRWRHDLMHAMNSIIDWEATLQRRQSMAARRTQDGGHGDDGIGGFLSSNIDPETLHRDFKAALAAIDELTFVAEDSLVYRTLNYKFGADERTVLFNPCLRGDVQLVRYLIREGAEVTARDAWDHTCLSLALERRNWTMLAALLEEATAVVRRRRARRLAYLRLLALVHRIKHCCSVTNVCDFAVRHFDQGVFAGFGHASQHDPSFDTEIDDLQKEARDFYQRVIGCMRSLKREMLGGVPSSPVHWWNLMGGTDRTTRKSPLRQADERDTPMELQTRARALRQSLELADGAIASQASDDDIEWKGASVTAAGGGESSDQDEPRAKRASGHRYGLQLIERYEPMSLPWWGEAERLIMANFREGVGGGVLSLKDCLDLCQDASLNLSAPEIEKLWCLVLRHTPDIAKSVRLSAVTGLLNCSELAEALCGRLLDFTEGALVAAGVRTETPAAPSTHTHSMTPAKQSAPTSSSLNRARTSPSTAVGAADMEGELSDSELEDQAVQVDQNGVLARMERFLQRTNQGAGADRPDGDATPLLTFQQRVRMQGLASAPGPPEASKGVVDPPPTATPTPTPAGPDTPLSAVGVAMTTPRSLQKRPATVSVMVPAVTLPGPWRPWTGTRTLSVQQQYNHFRRRHQHTSSGHTPDTASRQHDNHPGGTASRRELKAQLFGLSTSQLRPLFQELTTVNLQPGLLPAVNELRIDPNAAARTDGSQPSTTVNRDMRNRPTLQDIMEDASGAGADGHKARSSTGPSSRGQPRRGVSRLSRSGLSTVGGARVSFRASGRLQQRTDPAAEKTGGTGGTMPRPTHLSPGEALVTPRRGVLFSPGRIREGKGGLRARSLHHRSVSHVLYPQGVARGETTSVPVGAGGGASADVAVDAVQIMTRATALPEDQLQRHSRTSTTAEAHAGSSNAQEVTMVSVQEAADTLFDVEWSQMQAEEANTMRKASEHDMLSKLSQSKQRAAGAVGAGGGGKRGATSRKVELPKDWKVRMVYLLDEIMHPKWQEIMVRMSKLIKKGGQGVKSLIPTSKRSRKKKVHQRAPSALPQVPQVTNQGLVVQGRVLAPDEKQATFPFLVPTRKTKGGAGTTSGPSSTAVVLPGSTNSVVSSSTTEGFSIDWSRLNYRWRFNPDMHHFVWGEVCKFNPEISKLMEQHMGPHRSGDSVSAPVLERKSGEFAGFGSLPSAGPVSTSSPGGFKFGRRHRRRRGVVTVAKTNLVSNFLPPPPQRIPQKLWLESWERLAESPAGKQKIYLLLSRFRRFEECKPPKFESTAAHPTLARFEANIADIQDDVEAMLNGEVFVEQARFDDGADDSPDTVQTSRSAETTLSPADTVVSQADTVVESSESSADLQGQSLHKPGAGAKMRELADQIHDNAGKTNHYRTIFTFK